MISIILFLISVFCILYYGIILAYSGLHTSFAKFWPTAAMVSALFAVLLQSSWYLNLPHIVHLIFSGMACLVGIFFLILLIKILRKAPVPKESVDFLIVLGAIVRGETPSNSLKARIQAAEAYLKAHEDTIAILTGYKNPNASISQGECMQRELRKAGIPAYRLLVEPYARTTAENFQFSKDYMTKLSPTVAVLTNDFHLYRACRIGKKNGFANITGIGAKTPTPLLLHCYVRELFALCKHLIKA